MLESMNKKQYNEKSNYKKKLYMPWHIIKLLNDRKMGKM